VCKKHNINPKFKDEIGLRRRETGVFPPLPKRPWPGECQKQPWAAGETSGSRTCKRGLNPQNCCRMGFRPPRTTLPTPRPKKRQQSVEEGGVRGRRRVVTSVPESTPRHSRRPGAPTSSYLYPSESRHHPGATRGQGPHPQHCRQSGIAPLEETLPRGGGLPSRSFPRSAPRCGYLMRLIAAVLSVRPPPPPSKSTDLPNLICQIPLAVVGRLRACV